MNPSTFKHSNRCGRRLPHHLFVTGNGFCRACRNIDPTHFGRHAIGHIIQESTFDGEAHDVDLINFVRRDSQHIAEVFNETVDCFISFKYFSSSSWTSSDIYPIRTSYKERRRVSTCRRWSRPTNHWIWIVSRLRYWTTSRPSPCGDRIGSWVKFILCQWPRVCFVLWPAILTSRPHRIS